jgi:filamentous hemagglutinin family protein
MGLRPWLRAALMLALPGVLSQWPVGANPSHPVVTQGSAGFSTQGPQLTIHTTGNALINWSGFNIGAGETTTFIEPSATSVVWNHISDPNPTQILGHLDANGYVVLQNQSGFYIGGNAVINAAGLVMTTTPAVPLDVFGGGSWQFTAPPPTARIINYGEINAGPAGSVFLISHDIENHGDITAPGGNIGLCAGEQVLMSTRADGRGFSAAVTLPQGSVDNSGKLIADAGTIALNAQVVNQGGLIQANSVRDQGGVIEIVAADQLNLGPNSQILARGDDSPPGSPGGSVTLKSGNTFADSVGSQIITTGGAQGGNGGNVEVSAPNVLSLNSSMNASAQPGYTGGKLFLDPQNIVLSSGTGSTTATSGTVNEGDPPTTGTLTLNPNSLDSFSQILLQASQNITLASPWTLPASPSATTLTLQAGNNITFNTGDSLIAGNNWTVNLIAGANFTSLTGVTPNSTAGASSITLSGSAALQSANGSINLIAGGGITTGTGAIESTGGSILLQAIAQNISLGGTPWILPDSATPASVTLEAGNNLKIATHGGITAGQDWSLNLAAGVNNFSPSGVSAGSVTANSTSGASSITLSGNAALQTANGNINLIAGGGISVGTATTAGTIESTGGSQSTGGSILLQAIAQSISLGITPWNLPNSTAPASVTLEAGDNITTHGEITAGQDWSLNLAAGVNNFNSPGISAGSVTANSAAGVNSITLSGSAGLQSANGGINLIAGGGITTGTGTIQSTGGSILLQALSQNITLGGAPWNLPDSTTPTSVTLEAGNNITMSGGITAGQDWTLNLMAGVNNFNSPPISYTSVTANPAENLAASPPVIVSSITLSGSASLQTANGDINLIAGNGISITYGTIQSMGGAAGSGIGCGNILLQAISQDIDLGAAWSLPNSASTATVALQTAGNIMIPQVGGISAGRNWFLNLVAGANDTSFGSPFSPPTQAGVISGTGSVVLGGNMNVGAVLQTENGDINVAAGNSVIIGTLDGTSVSPDIGAIRTMNGGNITVYAAAGDVNTGNNISGYDFNSDVVGYEVDQNLGGISTAAGGNVKITAGGDITSLLPTATTGGDEDAGSGAFGPEPGVVTIYAGGSVYGHFVAADSVVNGVNANSIITAETGNAGTAASPLALSLVAGSWVVNALNASALTGPITQQEGMINLQEVRNPNGALGMGVYNMQNQLIAPPNVFNYSPDASVTLNAGNAVDLLASAFPRQSGYNVPCIFPPSLTINAGPGGVSLGTSTSGGNVILFPSPDGELTVNTTGSFEGNGYTLAMSDYGLTPAMQAAGANPNQWTSSTDLINGHAATPIQLNNTQPVVFNISGDMDDVSLVMPKATEVTVGGNMNNVNFTGQNLHSSDTTFFHVTGEIFDQNTYAFETLSTSLTLPAALYQGAVQNYLQLLQNAVIPGSGPISPNGGLLFPSLDLFYLPGTQQLGYYGIMDSGTEALLLGTLQEITYYPNGKPILNAQGEYVTTPVTFAGNPGGALYQAIQNLCSDSQNYSISPSSAPQGIVIGGPGQLSITAQSMNLGAATDGVSSRGPAGNNALASIPGKGAAINITLTDDLDMFASQISSWYGGAIDINVGGEVNAGLPSLPFQGKVPHGIWTSADSDVTVIAQGDVNIQGSRIAAFDGGNIDVESVQGNVDAGTGGLGEVLVNEVIVNPKTDAVTTPQQAIAGSGILATTLPDAPHSLEVGNITVDAPKGNIEAGLGGITQEPDNGNSSLTPTVNLTAGGNIDAGDTGVIAINVNAQATGKITGLFISSGNSTLHSDTSIDVTVLAGGQANLSTSATGTISGLAIAGGGINIGSGSFQGVALSQSVSGGGAQSALASTASASAGSQTAAAGEANSQKTETSDQPTSTQADDDLKRARAHAVLAKYTGRVTVLLGK